MARILIADDDPDILVLVEHTLVDAGYEVLTQTDATQVAHLAAEHAVDGVILDIQMPSISGFQALRRLREDPRVGGLPILFLSGRSDSQDRVRGLREGADDFLSKPFDPEELVLRVERLVSRPAHPAQGPKSVLTQDLDRAVVEGQLVSPLYLGRYKALEVVGKGAMGLVFHGWDPSLKRSVALKTVRLDRFVGFDQRQAMISRLLEEAVTVARFNHPNIVAVYDVAHDAETAFMAMEYIDGISLADLLASAETLDVEQTLAIGYGIAAGLAAAHEHRVVHHDMKPGNVLLGQQDTVKVTDFGVSQMITVLAKERDKVFGTPGYLPPEALLNEGYDETGDLFGLGAVLYQGLTGKPAIPGRNLHQIMLNTVRGPIDPLHELVQGVPRELEELVLQLLARTPTERPQSAAEVAKAIQEMAGGDVPRWQLPEGVSVSRPQGATQEPGSRLLTPMGSVQLDPTTPFPVTKNP